MKQKEDMVIGGIIKHKGGGVGFKLSFMTSELAQHYKEMLGFILKSDGFNVETLRGYHDKKEGENKI